MLKELLDNHKYLICVGLSTFSLMLTSISVVNISKAIKDLSTSLEPISIWAVNQNECVTKTWRIDGKDTQGIVSKVWSCNGGGE